MFAWKCENHAHPMFSNAHSKKDRPGLAYPEPYPYFSKSASKDVNEKKRTH